MDHNLTDKQVKLVVWIRDQIQSGALGESFTVDWNHRDGVPAWGEIRETPDKRAVEYSQMEALEADGFLSTISKDIAPSKKSGVNKQGVFQYGWPRRERRRNYTVLGKLIKFDLTTSPQSIVEEHKVTDAFIDESIIKEIREARNSRFDTARLAKYCEEVNDNFSRGNLSSAIFASRAILDHCPPIFGQASFASVAAQETGRSFKKIAQKLNDSLKTIADHHLHRQISPKEVLPTESEIDFRNELNYLLGRIIERLRDENDDDGAG